METSVFADKTFPNEWHVETIDDSGDIFVAVFAGPDAEERAKQYAELRERVATLEKERDAYLLQIQCSNDATRKERAEVAGEIATLRKALVAATPFLFEYGAHQNKNCYRSPDDGCYCGWEEARAVVGAALSESKQGKEQKGMYCAKDGTPPS